MIKNRRRQVRPLVGPAARFGRLRKPAVGSRRYTAIEYINPANLYLGTRTPAFIRPKLRAIVRSIKTFDFTAPVWAYRGNSSFKPGRLDELALHPTTKPVEMIADAIKDVSRRGGIVLDVFGGSGSTLIAAHKTGRRGFLAELDPKYVDRTIRRWEAYAHEPPDLQITRDMSALRRLRGSTSR